MAIFSTHPIRRAVTTVLAITLAFTLTACSSPAEPEQRSGASENSPVQLCVYNEYGKNLSYMWANGSLGEDEDQQGTFGPVSVVCGAAQKGIPQRSTRIDLGDEKNVYDTILQVGRGGANDYRVTFNDWPDTDVTETERYTFTPGETGMVGKGNRLYYFNFTQTSVRVEVRLK